MKIRLGQDVTSYLERAAFAALFVVFFCTLSLMSPIGSSAVVSEARADPAIVQPLEIITKTGSLKIAIEVAETAKDLARGLMFRRTLAPRHGMLFLYKSPQEITMWMRNTYISLDMVFIERNGRVRNIVRNTEPFSEELIYSGGDATAVLEIGSGQAAELNINIGDFVVHPHFKK